MVTLKKSLNIFIYSLVCLLSVSCAKTNYLYHQGIGQMKIFTKSRKNEDVLESVKVEDKVKEQIRYIQKLKQYFYQYWGKAETPIYSKTTILDQKAVTYLVITSDYQVIKADKECFPLMGCFPYLGFFKLEHAKAHAKAKDKQGKYTYVRPVYAYSTLGYFDDPILSSFFAYGKFDLTELVFHELFHTIYFIKDKVQLNENLANYFGKQMAIEYFKNEGLDTKEILSKESRSRLMRQKLVDLTKQYQKILKEHKVKNRQQADELLATFMRDQFEPKIKQYCAEIKAKSCFPLKRKWNNASLAAYLTYENESNKIEQKVAKENWTLKQFFSYIEQVTKKFEDDPKLLEEKLFAL